MTALRGAALVLALAGTVLVPSAEAQIVGLPVYFSPSADNGLRLFADVAAGDSPFHFYGGGRALLNLAYVSVGVMGGLRGDADAAWGGNVALNLVRGSRRRYSLSIEGCYGRNQLEDDEISVETRDIPIGVGLALETEKTGVVLEPWVGLRAHIRRSEVPGLGRDTEVGAGLSAGFNLGTDLLPKIGIPLKGVGGHVAVDWLTMPRPFADGSDGSLIVSLGLNYWLELKGLPLHGIIPPSSCDPTMSC
jgi:hypothetical protein